MEINITHLMDQEMQAYSASIAEIGENAGKVTSENAVKTSTTSPLLTADECKEARKYFEGLGAWDREELAAMTDTEINALTLQYIAGDIREYEKFDTYEEFLEASEKGQVSGNLFQGDNKQFYFYMGE